MRLQASLQLRQEMRLKLAPQIIQSIEILQLPLMELQERIGEELLENPMLEVGSSEEDQSPPEGEAGEDNQAAEPAQEDAQSPLEAEDYDALEALIQPAEYDTYGTQTRFGEGKDAKLSALENSPAPDISLEEHLKRQLAYLGLESPIQDICENIVANLDWRGYLEYSLEEIVDSMEMDVTPEQSQEALRIVQGLEPLGVGARDMKESLLLQLNPEDGDYGILKSIIEEHFEDIVRNQYPKVSKALGCTIMELKACVEKLARLNPIPGALFEERPAPHVIPDLRVELVEGKFRVVLEDSNLPSLSICSYYARRLRRDDLDPRTRQYLKEKLQGARWLIDAIQQRRSTIYDIASAIVEVQHDFLQSGQMHLRPLKMQEIADKVGVHVSTVSRAISGKYVQTPQGIYSLKHFFTGGFRKENGETESWEVVRRKLQDAVENEDKSNPLSDQQLAEALAGEGVAIARRTVSKYRKMLNIPSSRNRRQY
ncbi:MAG: RNA polymerase factor sigma-54 [Planctomycetes bacterium]|nr:RNA polymerase factor sigma-54 [Planctomycetota bacterium]